MRSLQKAWAYLEPKQASTMESFLVNILIGLLFSQKKLYHKCSVGLDIGLRKYWIYQGEAKVEQVIAIVTKGSVSGFNWKASSAQVPAYFSWILIWTINQTDAHISSHDTFWIFFLRRLEVSSQQCVLKSLPWGSSYPHREEGFLTIILSGQSFIITSITILIKV